MDFLSESTDEAVTHFVPVNFLHSVRRKALLHVGLLFNQLVGTDAIRKLIRSKKHLPDEVVANFPSHEQLLAKLHALDKHILDAALGLTCVQIASTVNMLLAISTVMPDFCDVPGLSLRLDESNASSPTVKGERDPDSMRLIHWTPILDYSTLYEGVSTEFKSGRLHKINAGWPKDEQECIRTLKAAVEEMTNKFVTAIAELDYRKIAEADTALLLSVPNGTVYQVFTAQLHKSSLDYESCTRFLDHPQLCSSVLDEHRHCQLARKVRQELHKQSQAKK